VLLTVPTIEPCSGLALASAGNDRARFTPRRQERSAP
jgi:hypothetical protein